LTLRNRELVNLLLVGLLTAAGFTAVYIARQDVVSAGSLSYAAFFLAVFVAAHVILRFALPNADPFLLPLGGLLTAVGLTMIYRIDPDLALRQGLWVVVGLAAFALLVVFLSDYRLLDRYKYVLGLTAIFLLALPAVPRRCLMSVVRVIAPGVDHFKFVIRYASLAGRNRQRAAHRQGLVRRVPRRADG